MYYYKIKYIIKIEGRKKKISQSRGEFNIFLNIELKVRFLLIVMGNTCIFCLKKCKKKEPSEEVDDINTSINISIPFNCCVSVERSQAQFNVE